MANISLETLKNIWANNGISETLQNAAEATGNGTAFDVDGYGVGRLVVSGTFSATIVPEGSIDGTNYFAIPVVDISTGVSALSITAKGNYLVNCQGLSNIRARISGYTSGTVTVLARVEKGSIPAGTGLSSIPEYNWFVTDGRPTPKETTKPAIGVEVDADTGNMVGLLWNGTNWKEV